MTMTIMTMILTATNSNSHSPLFQLNQQRLTPIQCKLKLIKIDRKATANYSIPLKSKVQIKSIKRWFYVALCNCKANRF